METRRPVTVRSHDDGVDRWEIVEGAPASSLRGRVARYASYSEHTRSFAARRELAGTSGVMIFALGEPLEVVGADGRPLTVSAGEAFVGGIADATSISRALGPQQGLHVFLSLDNLAAVIGAPLAEVANRVAPFRDLGGRAVRDLGQALCEAATAEARFALLDRYLAGRFARQQRGESVIGWAMQRLRGGAAPLTSALARDIGWSRQHFIRRFRAATGFAPDQFRRLCRFERFVAALTAAPGESLAALATGAGYVDQAHLTREVRGFAAMTPGELRQRLIPAAGGVRD